MAKIERFEELIAWKKARELTRAIYEVMRQEALIRDHGLRKEIQRDVRERSLFREFKEYRTSNQKRLKVLRLEAVRAVFKKACQERDRTTIITATRTIPENVLQEDPKLLMWYDQAVTRMGEET
jgi:hypothetical protein